MLLDQPSIRDPNVTVSQLIAQATAKTGENIQVAGSCASRSGKPISVQSGVGCAACSPDTPNDLNWDSNHNPDSCSDAVPPPSTTVSCSSSPAKR